MTRAERIAAAEDAIDADGAIRALDGAKDKVERAIRREARKAIRRAGARRKITVKPTRGMTAPLVALHTRGQRDARREARALGYRLPRRFGADDPPDWSTLPDGLGGVTIRLRAELAAYSTKLTDARNAAVRASRAAGARPGSLGDAITRGTGSAAGRLLDRVPGARDVASQLVSESYASGLGDVYAAAGDDVFGGYLYTAILDRGTCDVCAPLDGTVYPTLEALYEVLPNFGPNPSCHGGYRCRCRGVPLPPD